METVFVDEVYTLLKWEGSPHWPNYADSNGEPYGIIPWFEDGDPPIWAVVTKHMPPPRLFVEGVMRAGA